MYTSTGPPAPVDDEIRAPFDRLPPRARRRRGSRLRTVDRGVGSRPRAPPDRDRARTIRTTAAVRGRAGGQGRAAGRETEPRGGVPRARPDPAVPAESGRGLHR